MQKYIFFFDYEKYFFYHFVKVTKMLQLQGKIFSETPIFRPNK